MNRGIEGQLSGKVIVWLAAAAIAYNNLEVEIMNKNQANKRNVT